MVLTPGPAHLDSLPTDPHNGGPLSCGRERRTCTSWCPSRQCRSGRMLRPRRRRVDCVPAIYFTRGIARRAVVSPPGSSRAAPAVAQSTREFEGVAGNASFIPQQDAASRPGLPAVVSGNVPLTRSATVFIDRSAMGRDRHRGQSARVEHTTCSILRQECSVSELRSLSLWRAG